jgi:hypothetical protein
VSLLSGGLSACWWIRGFRWDGAVVQDCEDILSVC